MRAVLLGGTGAIGGMTALRLAKAGWTVDVTGRSSARMPAELVQAGVRFHQIERSDVNGVQELVGHGADLLVDLVAYSAADVRAVLPLMASVSCPVLVSSRAVYTDAAGRHVNGDEPPEFDAPIREDTRTLPAAGDDVNPFSRDGYAPCKVAAELVALDSGLPVTVIRPSKVHGPWARNARTKGIVGRMLRGEPTIELADPNTVDQFDGRLPAEHALNDAVGAGVPGPRAMDFRRADHGDRQARVECNQFGGDFAGRVPVPAERVHIVTGRRKRSSVFTNRRVEFRRLVAVDVPARGVGVDRPA